MYCKLDEKGKYNGEYTDHPLFKAHPIMTYY